MTLPVFFIKKKDGSLQCVQDYQWINRQTIKNAYPIPLISSIVEIIGDKKPFTKLDIHWRYNNQQIKAGDEWKAVFIMPQGSFELTVMFFSL